jgi:hypothetical protein
VNKARAQMIFTVIVGKSYLANEFMWAVEPFSGLVSHGMTRMLTIWLLLIPARAGKLTLKMCQGVAAAFGEKPDRTR